MDVDNKSAGPQKRGFMRRIGRACVGFLLICGTISGCTWYFLQEQECRYRAIVKAEIANMRMDSKLRAIEQEIAVLKTKLAEYEQSSKFAAGNSVQVRQHWCTWMALKSKMEEGDDFTQELARFNEVFACDNVLIGMVSEMIANYQQIQHMLPDVVARYVGKFVRWRYFNTEKLQEISGYVLSFCGNEGVVK